MLEREMQDLIWQHPERFFHEPLTQFAWELSSEVGRADLVFEDQYGRLLIIEIKRGKLLRGAMGQLQDYFGMMKNKYPEKPVEMMVIAWTIPPERRLACESYDIECREISEKSFRTIAADCGYVFESEHPAPGENNRSEPLISESKLTDKESMPPSWSFNRSVPSRADLDDFLARCNDAGKAFFSALFKAQESARQSKITWKHESGFSLQFYFHLTRFVPMVWGFPSKNRGGKAITQRLDFPFDRSVKAGVSEDFINEFGASLSSVARLTGGTRRPTIEIGELNADETQQILKVIFEHATKASQP